MSTRSGSDGATLTVTRAPADGLGDQYPISLRLDGERIGRLAPGERISRPIDAGEHRLRASNTLMGRSARFAAAPAERVEFLVRNRPGPGTGFFASLGAAWLYVGVEKGDAG